MQTLHIFIIFAILIPFVIAGLSIGSSQKHHKSSPQIKGGIGDGYIYPAKKKHQSSKGGNAQTYKLIIQNAGSQGGASQQHHTIQQPTQIKTFKVIQENAANQHSGGGAHGDSIKTIKLIHVNGGGGNCPSKGWQ